ncbi:AraC family transcriptional regulator [Glaciimonas soli]|uniref:Helix-turn-helix domain-containing protein n=1 Tax=Glaciimonas soli TaxID=2590999 RepID=A0A843YPX0_9BURK|nr:AraC family transcriptional regulator [Glaciimonas soli]MQQ99517.1 helix-turn-helix domain-containing protein [Glaciimonas soli]
MEKGSVSIHFVQSALRSIHERGLDTAALLSEVGIAPALLEAPQARVSATHYGALWLAVARTLDDEIFGQDSRRMKVGSFAMMCHTLIHCTTLKSALLCMLRFFNLLLDDYRCSLVSEGRYSRIVIQERALNQPQRVFGHETLLMMQHGLACWLIGRRIPIVAAAFAYPEPVYSAEYRLMYSTQLRFNEIATSLTFDQTYLTLPVIQNELTAKEFLRGAPANIVLKYKNSSSFSAKIRRRLQATAGTEWPDFDAFSAGLNMTRSTLRRRLEEEGQSFQAIKDQLRRDMAIDSLCHSSKSVIDISVELGFAEPSAFHRAFKKWTGASPGEYRQRMHKMDGM